MDAPRVWGPVLWKILHTSAENLGKKAHPIIQTDEVTKWMIFLKQVEFILPCALCRTHYKEWMKKHPILQFAPLRGEELRDRARLWLFKLHENINAEKGLENPIGLEDLPRIYGPLTTFQSDIERLISLLKENIQTGKLSVEAVWDFRKNFVYLRKLSGTAL
jgi:hypothetical protein